MTAHDTLRWGDAASLVIPFVAAGEALPLTSKQLVHATWAYPITWTMLFVMVPQFDKSETKTIRATWNLTVGVGQAQATFPRIYDFAPSSGVYAPIIEQTFLPAEAIQANVTLSGSPGAGADESFFAALFAAPMTEPHSGARLLELAEGARAGGPQSQWMPPGFSDDPLRYR